MQFRVDFAALVLVGCNGGSGPATVVLPHSLSSDALRLSSPIGVVTTATITATNVNAFSVIAYAELSELTSPELVIQDSDCDDALAPSASCTTTVSFTPQHLGDSAMGALALGSNWVSLDGFGDLALTISPTTRNFQTMYSDVDSAPFAFAIQTRRRSRSTRESRFAIRSTQTGSRSRARHAPKFRRWTIARSRS